MASPTSPKSPKSTRNAMPLKVSPRTPAPRGAAQSLISAGSSTEELFDESAHPSCPPTGFSRSLGWFHDNGRDGRSDQGLEISLNVWDLLCIALVRPVLSLSALCCEQDFRNLLNQPLRRRRIVTAIFSLSPTPSQGTQEISSKITYKSVFSVSSINPCALSTENGGCTIPKCESARCKRCRMVARAAGAPGRHFQSVTLLPFAVCALEGHGHGVSFGLNRRDYFVKLAELWVGGRIAHRAPIPRLVTVPGPNPDTGSRDLD